MMINPIKKIIVAAVLVAGLAAASPAQAQAQTQKTTWTLQECLDYGLQNNLLLKQSGLNRELAFINAKQARNNILPTVNGGTSYSINFGLNNDPTTGVLVNQNTRANSFSVNSNVPIFNGFQLRNTIKQNQLNYEASLSDLEKTKNDVILNIISQYLEIILSDELLQAAKLQLESSKVQAERTQKLFQAGSVAESNVFEINSQIATDEVSIINAQNRRDIAAVNLMQLLDLQDLKDFKVVKPDIKDPDEDVINFDATNVYDIAQQRMPEIKSADIRAQSALAGIRVSQGALMPQLSLGGNFSTNYFNLNKIRVVDAGQEQTFEQVIGLVNRDVNQKVYTIMTQKVPVTEKYTYLTQLQDNRGGGVFLNLQIPIFNGLSARNGVLRSKINYKNAVLNSEITRNQLRQTIQQSYADAVAAQKRFIAMKRQLAAFQLTFRNAEIRFNNGVMNTTDYNVARNNFTRAELDVIQAKYEYTFRLKVLDFYQNKPITF
ncbi:TolC family protein [Adhaeribacter radiodurans]|uniref:TolC family protein n=1 Tax=Adhaeribacter radiodurans TaxID=2745197 RepID=A0A7L7L763_9BACT|nr:TolC family protein [Adhaeribacter radiodurans]QMU28682.1 TolC family protein [Adhaeribacter radiodurans]